LICFSPSVPALSLPLAGDEPRIEVYEGNILADVFKVGLVKRTNEIKGRQKTGKTAKGVRNFFYLPMKKVSDTFCRPLTPFAVLSC